VTFAESLGFAVPTSPTPNKPAARLPVILHKPSAKPVVPVKPRPVLKNVAPKAAVSNFSRNKTTATQAVPPAPAPTGPAAAPFGKKKVFEGLF
jgi:hypothetical protein